MFALVVRQDTVAARRHPAQKTAQALVLRTTAWNGRFLRKLFLVGGLNHLEKYEVVNGKDDPIYDMENKTCFKPQTSYTYIMEYPLLSIITHYNPLLTIISTTNRFETTSQLPSGELT